MKKLYFILYFFTAFLFSAPSLVAAEQCRLSGYDQEYSIGVGLDNFERTFTDSGLSASQSGDGQDLFFDASSCISNNPKMDVFLDAGLDSSMTKYSETRLLRGFESSTTGFNFGTTIRRANNPNAEQCRLSGYDQEYSISLGLDNIDETLIDSGSSEFQSGDGQDLSFDASSCISNNPKMDVFLGAGLGSSMTKYSETRLFPSSESSTTDFSFGTIIRRANNPNAKQCRLSGYDQEYSISLGLDNIDETVTNSIRSSSTEQDLFFGASFCVSNNPKMDVFWSAGLGSSMTKFSETHPRSGSEGSATGFAFAITVRRANSPHQDVFLNAGLISVMAEFPETSKSSGVEGSATSLIFGVTIRR